MNIEEEQPSDVIDYEHVQLSLDSKYQTYMAQMSQKSNCCGKFFPLPFERAAHKSWWDPTFDSDILEEQYKKSSSAHITFKFRYALWYLVVVTASWFIYFLSIGLSDDIYNWQLICGILFLFITCVAVALILTYTRFYQFNVVSISLTITLLLAASSLAFLHIEPQPIGCFSICVQVLFLLYTLIPLKLYMSLSMGIFYSVTFETISIFLQPELHLKDTLSTLFVRLLCHFAIHLIGFHIYLMSNVRQRNTFIKVGQSLLARKELESEKRLKENMIHSLMPKSVADWLLHEDDNFIRRHSSESNDIRSLFRPFNMDHKENVSILFADIVGFTRMSTNKSAEELVEILNNIFQRFDVLCKKHNCEKISTLGDCYYCVSGCPEARPDHAKCCVEMGLNMIEAIKQFDEEKNEGINIRVGVHTGTVLCGIVGTRRFKFDVWSNDVTLANRMESTGKPGMVHISEKTNEYLEDAYILDEGESVFGLKTYFILGRKDDRTPSYSGSFRAEGRQRYTNSLQLFVSPPATSPSLSPQSRPRVLSCDTTSNYMKPNHNPNMLSPDVCKIKANSLPSILDIENEGQENVVNGSSTSTKINDRRCEMIETPTSSNSSSGKLKKLKFPKFKRKTSNQRNGDIEVDSISVGLESGSTAIEDGYQQVPTIIESNNTNKKESITNITEMSELNDESLDIKSYISQSRCDIGPFDYSPGSEFIRGGSYRSKYGRSPNEFSYLQRASSNRSRRGRSPNFDIIEPTERCRSATVNIGNISRPNKRSMEGNSLQISGILDDRSINSRKDSGIKSNSRRSSIQIDNPICTTDQNQHRVSGYYTSSQSSIFSSQMPRIYYEKSNINTEQRRKQSDLQLIKCVQDNSQSKTPYFIKPPLSQLTLFFTNRRIEEEFRINVHSMQPVDHSITTLASSRFNTYLDMFVSILVFIVISTSLLLVYGYNKFWLATFIICIFIEIVGFAFCFTRIVQLVDAALVFLTRFFRWNFFGSILVSLPLICTLMNYDYVKSSSISDLHLCTYLLYLGIMHFCNFTQLNCWIKNICATICSITFVVLFVDDRYAMDPFLRPNQSLNYTNNSYTMDDISLNITTLNDDSKGDDFIFYKYDVLLNLFLLLVLVWLLNREFEISYRLSFHANYVANKDKIHIQSLKNQADYLIYNIVPEHVADQLKLRAKYSENFKDVAIIFASIVNFNEMYDESYEGGKEYLRVLNELIGDFDELLDREDFRSVEKIKTIGSTFMAASGLNSHSRAQQKDPHEHLYALMDFAIEMQNVVNEFNRDLLEFNLILRIGYNFGDVTAAVIGKTKLYYDIWGDAVNIASRMDTTGVNGRIQVGENCLAVLENKYEFESRGYVYVKGKDHMNVYLLKRKRTPDLLCVPGMI